MSGLENYAKDIPESVYAMTDSTVKSFRTCDGLMALDLANGKPPHNGSMQDIL
jgi:hypothetical protein